MAKKSLMGPPIVTDELRSASRWLAWLATPLIRRIQRYIWEKAHRNGGWDLNRYDYALLEERRALGPLLRALAPNLCWCSHCGWPWNLVRDHSVDYEGGGFFVVCDWCYRQLRTYGDRDRFVTYCLQLCDEWGDKDLDSTWFMEQIERDWPSHSDAVSIVACRPTDL